MILLAALAALAAPPDPAAAEVALVSTRARLEALERRAERDPRVADCAAGLESSGRVLLAQLELAAWEAGADPRREAWVARMTERAALRLDDEIAAVASCLATRRPERRREPALVGAARRGDVLAVTLLLPGSREDARADALAAAIASGKPRAARQIVARVTGLGGGSSELVPIALGRGWTDLARELIARGAPTGLGAAAGRGDTERVRLLLDLGAAPDARALAEAARRGEVDVVDRMLGAGASPGSAATYTCGDADDAPSRLLLERGGDLRLPGMLSCAVRLGTAEDVLAHAPLERWGPLLSIAVRRGEPERVDLLIDAGVAPRAEDVALAIRLGNEAVLERLLARGAPLDDAVGHTSPLREAIARDDAALVARLIARGARVQGLCGGASVAALAVWSGAGPDVTRALLDAGAPAAGTLEAAASRGDLALVELALARGDMANDRAALLAAGRGELAVLERLLEAGAPLPDAGLVRALGASEAAERLVARGADPVAAARTIGRLADREGLTWLLARVADPSAARDAALAAVVERREGRLALPGAPREVGRGVGRLLEEPERGDPEAFVSAVLEAGAAPDLPIDALGRTPLMYAARYGHAGAIRALLAGGADPLRTDAYGRAARDFAALYHQREALGLLGG